MTDKTNYRTWTVGEVVTADMMNEQIRDNGDASWVGTTAGDLDYYSASNSKERIGIGGPGQVLTIASGVPAWSTDPVGCYLNISAKQTISDDTVTDISTWTHETLDSNNFHSGTNGYVTVPAGLGGFYQMGFTGYWDAHTTPSTRRDAYININSTNFLGQSNSNHNQGLNEPFHISFSIAYKLVAGDTVRVSVLQTSGSGLPLIPLNFGY